MKVRSHVADMSVSENDFNELGECFPTPPGKDIVVDVGTGKEPNQSLVAVFSSALICVSAIVFSLVTRDRAAATFLCFAAPFMSYGLLALMTGFAPHLRIRIPFSGGPALLESNQTSAEINGIWIEHEHQPEARGEAGIRIPAATVHTLVVNIERTFRFVCQENAGFCTHHCADVLSWNLLVRVVRTRNELGEV